MHSRTVWPGAGLSRQGLMKIKQHSQKTKGLQMKVRVPVKEEPAETGRAHLGSTKTLQEASVDCNRFGARRCFRFGTLQTENLSFRKGKCTLGQELKCLGGFS